MGAHLKLYLCSLLVFYLTWEIDGICSLPDSDAFNNKKDQRNPFQTLHCHLGFLRNDRRCLRLKLGGGLTPLSSKNFLNHHSII